MTISKEQSIGKIGEHLVCADLISQGYMAYIVAEGLNYDVILDDDGEIYKIQVRTTQKAKEFIRKKDGSTCSAITHRFYIRQGKGAKKNIEQYDVDVFGFVALDVNKIAYIPSCDIVNNSGKIKGLMEFRAEGRWGKTIDQFPKFPSKERIESGYGWLPRVGAYLTPDQVEEIRSKYKPYKYTAKMLAKDYGVNVGVIRNALNEKMYYKDKRKGVFGGKRE